MKKKFMLLVLWAAALTAAGCGGKLSVRIETADERTGGRDGKTEDRKETQEIEENRAEKKEDEAATEESRVIVVEDKRNLESEAEQEEYIFPDSGRELIKEADVAALSPDEIKLARNEIYARHGRKFKSSDIQAYFSSKSWYQGSIEPEDFREEALNQTERDNILFLSKWEEQAGGQNSPEQYRKVVETWDLLDQYGLCAYGYIEVSSHGDKKLKDHGNYYEVTEQRLSTPIYYDWDYVKKLKIGDRVNYDEDSYKITAVLQEEEGKFRLFQTEQPGGTYEPVFCFEDIFGKGKYAMAQIMEGVPEVYTDYNHTMRSNGLVDCSSKYVYRGSFYLAKDCTIQVNDEEFTVDEMMDGNKGWGFIAGWIDKIDKDGYITNIRQQTAG